MKRLLQISSVYDSINLISFDWITLTQQWCVLVKRCQALGGKIKFRQTRNWKISIKLERQAFAGTQTKKSMAWMAGILMLSVQYIFDESHSLFSKFDCGFIDSLSWACNHKIYFLAWLWMSICFNCTPGWGKNRPAQSNFEIEVIRWWEMTKIYFLAFFGWWKTIFFDVAKELQMCSHCWRKIHQMQELPSWFIAVSSSAFIS